MKTVALGLLIPFIGTAGGAACVFFLKKTSDPDCSALLQALRLESWLRHPSGAS